MCLDSGKPLIINFRNTWSTGFPHGPVGKNSPSNSGDLGSIHGWGTKMPHDTGQLSLRVTTTEPRSSGVPASQRERSLRYNYRARVLWSRGAARKRPRVSATGKRFRMLQGRPASPSGQKKEKKFKNCLNNLP